MKKILLIPCFVILFSCENKNKNSNSEVQKSENTDSNSKNRVSENASPENIEEIKAEFAALNNQLITKKLDSSVFEYECNEITGNVVFYTSGGDLQSIKHFYSDSHFSSVENYYMKNGKPYFILKQDAGWSFDGGTPEKPETKDNIEEQRIYIVNDEAIACLEKKYTIRSGSANNPNPENIKNAESKNCSYPKLQKTFATLIKNKEKMGKIGCIQ